MKKTVHYLLTICAGVCILMTIFATIHACFDVFSPHVATAFFAAEIVLGLVWLLLLLLSKILWKINFSSFDHTLEISAWRWYVVLFQMLLFAGNILLHSLHFSVGQSFYCIILSHFYWVMDIGYIFPQINK